MGDWKLVSAREDQDVWELFDLSTDRCEQKNLAAEQPDRVREMETRWKEPGRRIPPPGRVAGKVDA